MVEKSIVEEAERFEKYLRQLGYIKPTLCRDCMAFDEKKVLCKKNNMIAVRVDDWCSRAVKK